MERIELNLHTKYSKMDGLVDIKELFVKAKFFDMDTIAITDYATVQGFLELEKYSKRDENKNIKVLYGMEAYFVNDDICKDVEKIYHIIIFAKNRVGLKNLYKIVSDANINNFYKKPIVLKSILNKYREGLIIGSCYRLGEVTENFKENKSIDEIKQILSYYDYIEVEPIDYNNLKNEYLNNKLEKFNESIICLANETNKIVVATGRVHYLDKNDKISRKILKYNTGEEYDNQENLYFKDTEEMLKGFAYLDDEKAYEIVVKNPNKIADMIEKFDLFPKCSYGPKFENAKQTIVSVTQKRLREKYGENIDENIKFRYEYELKNIFENEFENIYMLAYLIMKKTKEDGEFAMLRGAGSSSLIAYLLGISYVDPIEYELPFEIFAGIDGYRIPDFDFNFSTRYQPIIHQYVIDLLGKEKVFYCGKIGVLSDNNALKMIKKYSKANNVKLNEEEIVENLIDVVNTSDIHPGRLIICPENMDIYDFTPIQMNDEAHFNKDKMKTHLSYHYLDALFMIDLLSYSYIDDLLELEKITRINHLKTNIRDEKIMDLFKEDEMNDISTDDLPEFKSFLEQYAIKKAKPNKIQDLIKINSVIHGTGTWECNIENLIASNSIDKLACSRDDIYLYLIKKGIDIENAFKIMEFVRKGRAYKVTQKEYNNRLSEYESEWIEYTLLMKLHEVPDWYIKSLEKIKYIFPKAHACNYVIFTLMIAWYKVNFKEKFENYMKQKLISKTEKDIDTILNEKFHYNFVEISNTTKEIFYNYILEKNLNIEIDDEFEDNIIEAFRTNSYLKYKEKFKNKDIVVFELQYFEMVKELEKELRYLSNFLVEVYKVSKIIYLTMNTLEYQYSEEFKELIGDGIWNLEE